jgi:hypothetical protein
MHGLKCKKSTPRESTIHGLGWFGPRMKALSMTGQNDGSIQPGVCIEVGELGSETQNGEDL